MQEDYRAEMKVTEREKRDVRTKEENSRKRK